MSAVKIHNSSGNVQQFQLRHDSHIADDENNRRRKSKLNSIHSSTVLLVLVVKNQFILPYLEGKLQPDFRKNSYSILCTTGFKFYFVVLQVNLFSEAKPWNTVVLLRETKSQTIVLIKQTPSSTFFLVILISIY